MVKLSEHGTVEVITPSRVSSRKVKKVTPK